MKHVKLLILAGLVAGASLTLLLVGTFLIDGWVLGTVYPLQAPGLETIFGSR